MNEVRIFARNRITAFTTPRRAGSQRAQRVPKTWYLARISRPEAERGTACDAAIHGRRAHATARGTSEGLRSRLQVLAQGQAQGHSRTGRGGHAASGGGGSCTVLYFTNKRGGSAVYTGGIRRETETSTLARQTYRTNLSYTACPRTTPKYSFSARVAEPSPCCSLSAPSDAPRPAWTTSRGRSFEAYARHYSARAPAKRHDQGAAAVKCREAGAERRR